MIQKIIYFCDQSLLINYPPQAAQSIDFTFQQFQTVSDTAPLSTITVKFNDAEDSFTVDQDGKMAGTGLDPVELSLLLLSRVAFTFSRSITGRPAILGSALAHNNKVVLIVGDYSPERSLLTTWLLSRGYQAITNNLLVIDEHTQDCFGLPLPIHIKKDGVSVIEDILPLHDDKLFIQNERELLFFPGLFHLQQRQHQNILSLILFSEYRKNKSLQIETTTPGMAAGKLFGFVSNSNNQKMNGLAQVSSLTRKIPALSLGYNRFDPLEGSLEPIISNVLDTKCDPDAFARTIRAFQIFDADPVMVSPEHQKDSKPFPIQSPTPIGPKRKLTIGMATYDDFDGVYFSVQALRMYHPEITSETEILVIDNHPDGPCSESLKKLDESIDGFRYFPLQGIRSTSVRDFIFYHAIGDYVLCIDSHVLIVPGAVKKLLDYYDAHPDTNDLLQGPMIYDDLQSISTHFRPKWRGGMYGTWDHDKRGDDPSSDPFEIPMQGLGLFSCRKVRWPGFNPRFQGFGGEEGYIHEKFKQAGDRTLCLPFLRWLHRFGRPMGVPYPLLWKDRIHNYLIGFRELDMDTQPIRNHMIEILGEKTATTLYEEVVDELESPFYFFDAIYCITLGTDTQRWQKMVQRFKILGIEQRVRVFPAVETPDNHHIGCTLSHRSIIEAAKLQNLDNVLVFEDDAVFLENTLTCLKRSVSELRRQDWSVFYLGGHRWGNDSQLAQDCLYLKIPESLTCTHALAYHHRVYDRILTELPDNEEKMAQWVKEKHVIDQYLSALDRLFFSHPSVATQIELLQQEEESYQDRFNLD